MRTTFLREIRFTLLALLRQVQQSQLFTAASSLAYTSILSIIPAIAVSFAVFRAVGGASHLYETLEPFILSNLAQGTGSAVLDKLHEFIDNAHVKFIGIGGLVGLVFTTTTLFASVEQSINRIWETEGKRGFFLRYGLYALIIGIGPLALAVALGIATSKSIPMTRYLPSGSGAFGIGIFIFFCIYKYVPNCKVRSRYALASALVASFFWSIARLGFTLYSTKAIAYGKIYGSLAAVPILLIWIYIVWIVVLLGAAFSAVLQKRHEEQARQRSHPAAK
jgi:membrane protein